MRTAARISTPLVCLAIASGCAAPLDPEDDPSSRPEEASSALELSWPSCGGERWVTLREPAACADSPGFQAEPLFPPSLDLPTLAGYCLHTWTGPAAPTVAELDAWTDTFEPGTLAEDCAFVTPLAHGGAASPPELLAAHLRDSIVYRIGAVQGPHVPGPAVHVAVIDTTPDAPAATPVTGNNRHGDTLAALISEVVKVPGAVATSTSLAMPWSTDPVTQEPYFDVGGGDFGYLSDLSRALLRAVQEHRASHAGAPFVINLSLGWEPHNSHSSCSGPLLPAVKAVRDVLDLAACEDGALIVAAAGNDMGGPSPGQGLTCPAAWMSKTPSCAPARPLVIAAYGLDYADKPLAVARPGSASPFAAPAIGGVAWRPGTSPPPPLSGTSVSAAAVTASLAAVWAFAPELRAEEVAGLLHEHALGLSAQADVCAEGLSTCEVRRISPCGALSALDSPWTCSASTTTLAVSNPPPDPALLSQLLASQDMATPLFAAVMSAPLPSDLAPAAGGQNNVYPSPIIPTCPNCFLSLGNGSSSSNPTLHGTLSHNVSAMVLVVNSGGSSVAHRLSSAPSSSFIPAGSPLVAPLGAGSATSAWISATHGSTGLSILEQILIVP